MFRLAASCAAPLINFLAGLALPLPCCRFASLFNQSINLAAAMENGHPLVMLCAGSRGIAPVRAALSWTPVLAHASNSCVALYYVADSPSSAAYLVEWDTWREAGVSVWGG